MIEASGLLEETPGAPRPQNDTSGEIAAFGDRQTGQLDKANADKRGVKGMLGVCRTWQERAAKEAERKTKRWFQRIF